MTLDFTINAPTILGGIGAIVTLIIWLVRLEGKTDGNKATADTLTKTLSALEALVQLHHQEFQQYRLEAAEKYVTREAVMEIKRDLSDEMKDMERRLEAAFDRTVKAVQGQ